MSASSDEQRSAQGGNLVAQGIREVLPFLRITTFSRACPCGPRPSRSRCEAADEDDSRRGVTQGCSTTEPRASTQDTSGQGRWILAEEVQLHWRGPRRGSRFSSCRCKISGNLNAAEEKQLFKEAVVGKHFRCRRSVHLFHAVHNQLRSSPNRGSQAQQRLAKAERTSFRPACLPFFICHEFEPGQARSLPKQGSGLQRGFPEALSGSHHGPKAVGQSTSGAGGHARCHADHHRRRSF